MINIEFLLIFADYFKILRWRNFNFEWLIPIIISFALYYFIYYSSGYHSFQNYIEKIISLEGVLVGFSITIITFLTTASNKNIDELKITRVDYIIKGEKISIYDLIIINYSYSLALEIFILMTNLLFPFLVLYFHFTYRTKVILMVINIFFVIHNLHLNIRNLTDIYHVLRKK
jgi:hypothetical protein